ncbi:nucleosidase [Rhodococcus sp. D2-41]|uniref:nucleosidase n=1 Tax=Speluncibacter jeojiensis TaxID=2710754 RepID=UPI00240F5721|nr:nucleosidase [Rhodococcus sp. D2-41]MDG3008676.1 nucleosidase [Rhodococcus sp. D2-41]
MTERDVLVVSATKSEAAHVPADFELLICGIGKVDAAVAVTAALARRRVDLVVNIGTVGALPPGLSGLHLPSSVINHDLSADVLRELGYPAEDRIEIPGGDGVVLATGDSFISDADDRDLLARRAHLVDMEGFAIARACREFDVPCRLAKYVTDDADESALDWPARVDAAAQVLGKWLGAFGAQSPATSLHRHSR